MAEPEKGWRGLADDAQRVYFILGLVAAAVAATVAGTYWGWWAYMWDVALPIRVVGVLAIAASAFVLWYGLLFSSYYYLGWPKRNPLVPVKSREDQSASGLDLRVITESVEKGVCRLMLVNRGKTDTFSARFEFTLDWGQQSFPSPWLKWEHSESEKLEIISGQDAWLHVLRVSHDRNSITGLHVITSRGEAVLPAAWVAGSHTRLQVDIVVVSVSNGSTLRLEGFLNVVAEGYGEPNILWIVRTWA